MTCTCEELNRITGQVIGAAIRVHKALGPGLPESAYEECLAYELIQSDLKVDRQKALPLLYHEVRMECGYRLDLMVEEKVVVEVKAVEHLLPIHEMQLLSYLRLTGCRVGLLINFNVETLKKGVRRLVNSFPDSID